MGKLFTALAQYLATVQITGNPTVDASIRYGLFGVATAISGIVLGWLNARGWATADMYIYVPILILALLTGAVVMIWGLVKTSKFTLFVQLREAIAVKAGIAAAEHDDPTPEVTTVKDAQKVIAQHAPVAPPQVK